MATAARDRALGVIVQQFSRWSPGERLVPLALARLEPMPVTSATERPAGRSSAVDAKEVELVATLLALRSSALDLEEACRVRLDAIPERDRPSGRNLVHYLALRQHDAKPTG